METICTVNDFILVPEADAIIKIRAYNHVTLLVIVLHGLFRTGHPRHLQDV